MHTAVARQIGRSSITAGHALSAQYASIVSASARATSARATLPPQPQQPSLTIAQSASTLQSARTGPGGSAFLGTSAQAPLTHAARMWQGNACLSAGYVGHSSVQFARESARYFSAASTRIASAEAPPSQPQQP